MILARVLWMLLLAALGGVLAAWLVGHPGWLQARWLGWEVETSAAALLAFVAGILGVFLLLRRIFQVFKRR